MEENGQVEADDGSQSSSDLSGRDLANFLLDLSDDSCPLARLLHLPAYNGDAAALIQTIRQVPEARDHLDSKIRPFAATPLRLAATGKIHSGVQPILNLSVFGLIIKINLLSFLQRVAQKRSRSCWRQELPSTRLM